MTEDGRDTRRQITAVLDSLTLDRERSKSLFEYVWTLICIRRGLLAVVDEAPDGSGRLVVEEPACGRRRTVVRPVDLDARTEGLAVQALSRLIEVSRKPS